MKPISRAEPTKGDLLVDKPYDELEGNEFRPGASPCMRILRGPKIYPHKTGVMGNIGAAGGDAMTMDTVGKKLQAAGYYTGYFGKWHIGHDANGTTGWNEEIAITAERPVDEVLAKHCIGFLDKADLSARLDAWIGKNSDPFATFTASHS
jgi:hypothetical protein